MSQEFYELCEVQTDEEVRTDAKEWATSLKDNECNVIMDNSDLGANHWISPSNNN